MADEVADLGDDIADLKLAALIDTPMLQSMLEDFYALTRIPTALIDLEGAVVVGVGWQDVCIKFHRVNAETCAYCVESDTVLTADIPPGEARLYHCKNGMWDAATPILVGDVRVGNLFTGQFFFDDEPVDLAFFREQARRYGFDEADYLAAIASVARLSRETVDVGLRFLTKMSNMISQLSFSNIRRSRTEGQLEGALASQTALTQALADEREVLQAVMENTDTHLAYLDPDFNFVAVNSTYAQGSGHTEDELLGRNHFELFPNEENEAIFERVKRTGEPAEFRAKPFEFADQPWRGVTYWDWRLTPVKDRDGVLQGFAFSLQDVTRLIRQQTFSDAINRLNDIIHSDLDFASVLTQFVPELAAATHCEFVAVALRSGDGTWRFADVHGLPAELKARTFADDELPGSSAALRSRAPVVMGVGEDAEPIRGLAVELGIKSLLVVPLSVPARPLGAVSCGYLSGPGGFDENEIDFAGKVGASLSLAMNNSMLFHDQRHSARLSGALATVNEILLSALTREDVVARLVGEASEVAGADKSLVVEVKGGEYTITHVRNVSADLVGRARDVGFFPAFALAASAGHPVLIEDNWEDSRTNKDFVRPYGLRAFQLLPLKTQGVVTHVLALAYEEPQSFDDEDRSSAERMAEAMSLALNNARMYENEHRIADRLQEALLALPVRIGGVDFAHVYHSAAEMARVGGDFYDIFSLDGGRIGVTIGDVAGKGLDAAVLTSLAKNTLRAYAMEREKTPRQILGLTNEVVFEATEAESFVTIFFGLLDPNAGRLVYGNAGHTTAMIVKADGSLVKLPVTGPLLGAFAGVEFRQAEVRVDVGDTLFLYTDGVTEARANGVQYGEGRLAAVLSSCSRSQVADVVTEVLEDVVSHAGGELQDDLAMLAVRRVADGDGEPGSASSGAPRRDER